MQKTSLNHLRLILYIMSTFLPLVIYQQVSCQDQTIPLPIQDSPQIPIIQENLAINDISYLMQPEDQPLTTKINEQKNAQPKDAITQNNSKKKRLKETNKKKALRKEKKEKRKKEKALRKKKHPEQEQKSNTALDFCVENKTGKTIYIVCFSYMKKNQFRRWHWNKSNTYMLDDNKTTTIAIPHINDEQDKANIFGYLAIFDNQKDAEESIFELLHDKNKIELDLLIHLNRKKVVLEVEKYGIVGDFFDYDFVFKKQEANHKIPELDFVVENQTGKTTHIAC